MNRLLTLAVLVLWTLAVGCGNADAVVGVEGDDTASSSAKLGTPTQGVVLTPTEATLKLNRDLTAFTELVMPKAAATSGYATTWAPKELPSQLLAKDKVSSLLFLCHRQTEYTLRVTELELTNPVDKYVFDANVVGPNRIDLTGALWRTSVSGTLVFSWPHDDTVFCNTPVPGGHIGHDYYFEVPFTVSDFELEAQAHAAAQNGALKLTGLDITKFEANSVVLEQTALQQDLEALIGFADGLASVLETIDEKLAAAADAVGIDVTLPAPPPDVCGSGTSVADLTTCLNSVVTTQVLQDPALLNGLVSSVNQTLTDALPDAKTFPINGASISVVPSVTSYTESPLTSSVSMGVTVGATPVATNACGAGAIKPKHSGAGPAFAEKGDLELVVPWDVVEDTLYAAARAGALCQSTQVGTLALSLAPAGEVSVRGPPLVQMGGMLGAGGSTSPVPAVDFTSSIPMAISGPPPFSGALTLTLEIDWTLTTPCSGTVSATAMKARVLNLAGGVSVGPISVGPATPSVVTAVGVIERDLPGKIGTVPLLPMPGTLPLGLWLRYLGKDSTDQAVRFAWNLVDVMPICQGSSGEAGCPGTMTPMDYQGPTGIDPNGGVGTQQPSQCSASGQ